MAGSQFSCFLWLGDGLALRGGSRVPGHESWIEASSLHTTWARAGSRAYLSGHPLGKSEPLRMSVMSPDIRPYLGVLNAKRTGRKLDFVLAHTLLRGRLELEVVLRNVEVEDAFLASGVDEAPTFAYDLVGMLHQYRLGGPASNTPSNTHASAGTLGAIRKAR